MDSKHRPAPDSTIDSKARPAPDSTIDSKHHPAPDSTKESVKRKDKRGIDRTGWIIIVCAGTAVVGLLAIGILPRLNQRTELQDAAKVQSALPSVNVITPQRAPAATNLVLPGSVVSLNQTSVYARTTGYLRRWLVDIGDRVQAGQLLAEIDSPDVDQQVAQARADLAQTQANLVLSRANLAKGRSDLQQARANLLLALQTWNRWKVLVQQGVVSQQDADTRRATYDVNVASVQSAQNTVSSNQAAVYAAEATVNSSKANLHRYQVLQSFEKVTAPFTGIITSRNVDGGALITPGSGNTTTSLYTIAAYNDLDVNVNIPQPLAPSVQIGQTAQIQVREFPQRVFTGKVIRTTNAVDPSSRTLLTQIAVSNPEGVLRPGMYASAKLNILRNNPPLMVPDNTLVINSGGTQVATVTKNQTVHYQKVQLGRDNGTETEITSGLSGNESLISNATVDLVEGTRVRAVAAHK